MKNYTTSCFKPHRILLRSAGSIFSTFSTFVQLPGNTEFPGIAPQNLPVKKSYFPTGTMLPPCHQRWWLPGLSAHLSSPLGFGNTSWYISHSSRECKKILKGNMKFHSVKLFLRHRFDEIDKKEEILAIRRFRGNAFNKTIQAPPNTLDRPTPSMLWMWMGPWDTGKPIFSWESHKNLLVNH